MNASAPRRERAGEAALWPVMTGALVVIATFVLVSCYGALHLSQALTHHARTPWAALGPTLLVLVHSAAMVEDSLFRCGRIVLPLAALYTLCFGYGLYQVLAVYGPGLAHTAARLL